MIQQRLYNLLAPGALALLLCAQVILDAGRAGASLASDPFPAAGEPPTSVFPPRLLQWLSVGQLPVVVDSLWIRALQHAEPVHEKRDSRASRPQLFHDLDALTELDPANFLAYQTGVMFLTVVLRDPEGARRLADKGLHFEKFDLAGYPAAFVDREWPMRWNLHLLKAYLYMFELSDVSQAGDELLTASRYFGAPEYLKAYARRLGKPDGRYEVGLRLLNWLLANADEGPTREGLERQRASLHVSQYLFNLNRDFRGFLDKMPEYASDPHPDAGALAGLWLRYRNERGLTDKDPWGGDLQLNDAGIVSSTTPRERVLGLE